MSNYFFYPAGEGMAGKVELICDVVPDPVTGAQSVFQQFRVDPEQLLIWQPALVRDYKNAGGRFVKRDLVFAAGVARIHTEVEGYTIQDSVAVHVDGAFVMETEWLDPHGVRRSKRQVIEARRLRRLRTWFNHPSLGLTGTPHFLGYVVNTITAYSLECGIESVYEFDRTGYVYVDSTGGDDRPSGWMYVHGGEEDVIAALAVPADCGVRAVGPVAGLCQPLECSDRNGRRDAVAEMVNHWVLGGISEGLAPSQAKFVARFAALGAISVARALVPGKTPRTTVMVVDPDDYRSSILVRSITSFFGPVAARRPLVDLRLATAAGGEASVGAARHLAVYLADYNGRSEAHKIVDGTARGAYDGMVKSRATSSMKSANENPVETMAWITGDRFPTKFT